MICSRPCTCGGTVVASEAEPGPGVRAHQATLGHIQWAYLARLRGELDEPESPRRSALRLLCGPVDVSRLAASASRCGGEDPA